jgi:transcription-repair coupling factor (superfamily II helicase)
MSPFAPRRFPRGEEWRARITATDTFCRLTAELAAGRRPQLAGLPGSLGAVLAAALLGEDPRHRILAVVPDPDEATELQQDLAWLLGPERALLLPAWPTAPYEEAAPGPLLSARRYEALCALSGEEGGGRIVICPAAALPLPNAGARELAGYSLEITEGEEKGREELALRLAALGYERVDLVGSVGEFAVRGGVVDVAPPEREVGLRVEFWGDRVESLREFQLRDQRSVGGVGHATVPPLCEIPFEETARERALRRWRDLTGGDPLEGTPLAEALARGGYQDGLEWYLPLFVEAAVDLEGLLADDARVVVWEPVRVEEVVTATLRKAADRYAQLRDAPGWLPPDRLLAGVDQLARLRRRSGADLVTVASAGGLVLRTDARPVPAVAGDLERLRAELRSLQEQGITPCLLVEDEGQRTRLEDLLALDEDARPELVLGQLAAGFVWPQASLALWPDHEIFHRPRRRRGRVQARGEVLRSWRALERGDLVVHIDHGIGRFLGLRTLEVDGERTELLELEYAGRDRLLVPIDQMGRVQRYVGGEEEQPPALNTLGGAAWERAKQRARIDLLEMARDLARIYAARQALEGTAHPPDDLLMEELEASFPWTETPDQARTVAEVKRDLEQLRPMDRLVCGDVGYGKTEVAIRAALKVIEGGRQVAVLVPTTLLAQQHLETFRQRLGRFPVRVEMLSRFRTPAQQRRTLEGLASGQVDLVIGTHRLLSPDVVFARLGLIVVDEEHRFGVRAKEALRTLRTQVDLLSLTATPIPRTLHMSLLGIRDMSIITTPPQDRLPVHTEVVTWEEELVRSSIQAELDRGGQVFFVHNRVQSIEAAARLVRRLVPAARVGLAHGQMRERELEAVMLRFAAGTVDVLVATMIVESGLDLPNANTLIVNRADRFGLAQLYQLRGRVGRSDIKAYAWFLVPPGRRLPRDAWRRLQAVQDHADLGAGFHLAMRDLEIRGAGNLLGAQQHGHIATVGYDLYTQLLEEAVAEIQGQPEAVWSPPRLELPGAAYLPEPYVPTAALRMDFYRRAAEARSVKEVSALAGELRDRFGPPPPEAAALVEVSLLRVAGAELGLESVVVGEDGLSGRFPPDRVLERSGWEALLARLGPDVQFAGEAPLRFRVRLAAREPLERLRAARNRLLTPEEAGYLGAFESGSDRDLSGLNG